MSKHVLPHESTGDNLSEPLLEPKFHPPRLHAALIERADLLAKLDRLLQQKLTLLCAPAGSGKTTALRQWIEQAKKETTALPTAWLALEKSDNDPRRFWRYVLTACRTFESTTGQEALVHMLTPQPALTLPSLEKLLTLFLNDLTRLPGNVLLILEDYHLIAEPAIHETLQFFLDHLPSQVHVVMLTRGEPPLPLARWRARGELGEISAADLRFSPTEMERFLHQTLDFLPAQLPSAALNLLDTRLEGWAAGLRLLTLALQNTARQENIEQSLAAFAGQQRPLQEYFVSEALDTQPEAWQDFILSTSVLARLNGSLCDTVAGHQDSAGLLAELERAGLFLEALDSSGGWYRYHALFAEAMQVEVRRRRGETALYDLALKASYWYEQQGMLTEAIETAFQARDLERAAGMIENILSHSHSFLLNPRVFEEINGFHTLRRWLEMLPPATFRGHPWLSLGYATALLLILVVDQQPVSEIHSQPQSERPPVYTRLLETIEDRLQAAASDFQVAGDDHHFGGILAFRALIAREQGQMGEAVHFARKSLTLLPANEQEWSNLALNVIGMGKLIDGELEEARTIFLEQCARCAILGNHAILRANSILLNIVHYEQGKLRQTELFFTQTLAEARAENDYDDMAHACLMLAWHAYERNDLQAAGQWASESFELGQMIGNEEFQVLSRLILARLEYISGESVRARQFCTELLVRLPALSPLRQRLNREVLLTQASFALADGDLATVESWLAACPPDPALPLALRVREELLRVRWQLTQDHISQALLTLTHLLAAAQQAGRQRSAFEISVVLFQVQHTRGLLQEAAQTLQALLAGAQAEGYLRLFLDEGQAMLTRLRTSLSQMHERSLLATGQTILRAAHSDEPDASALLAEPLSPQEQRVLRLLLAGHSNPEIARDLVVSVNTVKAHIKNIYRKLNVNNRLEASAAARLLGLS